MKSANQILADNLNRLMEGKYTNLSLGKRSGLAPNTIGNYRKFDPNRSAKLNEVEKLASALNVSLLDLLTEQTDERRPIPASLTKDQQQYLLDLDDLPLPKQSKIIDMVRQQAEEAREAVAYHEKKRVTSAASSRSKARATTSASFGDGHPKQRHLPLTPAKDPFRADPNAREAALYERIEKTPKAG